MVHRALVAVALFAGSLAPLACGGEARHDVGQGVQQLASISAEGALMADDLARGRTKTTFVRVHGGELSAQAEHESEKLNDAPVADDLEGRVQAAIMLASKIGGAIDDLRTSPQDRQQARQDREKLSRWSDAADKLANSI
jgi:hypothetical protein